MIKHSSWESSTLNTTLLYTCDEKKNILLWSVDTRKTENLYLQKAMQKLEKHWTAILFGVGDFVQGN